MYIPTLAGGGAEQSMLRLAETFVSQGYAVDLVVNRMTGSYADRVSAGIRVCELARHRKTRARLDVLRAYPGDLRVVLKPVLLARKPIMTLPYLPGLVNYLARARPTVLVSALFYANLLAVWARRLARVSTRIVVSEHNTLSRKIAQGHSRRFERARWQYLAPLVGRVYARADAIVAVSDGVADDLAQIAKLDRTAVTTIYNPVVFPTLPGVAATEIEHPWFAADAPPVILAAGRLEVQKDFCVLIEAFADVRRQRQVRLMILGEGSLRAALQGQVEMLGIVADVELHGWVDNPYAYMNRAAVFVLSSVWEGLGNVLIEAMACGCPVVATDCPSGPHEILSGGRHGALVPVSDAAALAQAIIATLDGPREAAALRRRAGEFSIVRSADQYLALIAGVTADNKR